MLPIVMQCKVEEKRKELAATGINDENRVGGWMGKDETNARPDVGTRFTRLG